MFESSVISYRIYKKHSLRSQRRRCLGGSDRHVRYCKAKGLRPQYSRKDPHNVRVLSLAQVENSLKTLTRRWESAMIFLQGGSFIPLQCFLKFCNLFFGGFVILFPSQKKKENNMDAIFMRNLTDCLRNTAIRHREKSEL